MHEEYIMILSDDLCIPESPKISDSYIIFLNCSYLVVTGSSNYRVELCKYTYHIIAEFKIRLLCFLCLNTYVASYIVLNLYVDTRLIKR